MRNLVLTVLLLSPLLINCGDSNPFDKGNSTVRVASLDGVKYISPGVDDPYSKKTFLQNEYTIYSGGRLLLRYESLGTHRSEILVEQPLLLRIEVNEEETGFQKAKEDLKLCPIQKNWMMAATWWRAHPFIGGDWAQGGEIDWDGCVNVATLENPPEEVEPVPPPADEKPTPPGEGENGTGPKTKVVEIENGKSKLKFPRYRSKSFAADKTSSGQSDKTSVLNHDSDKDPDKDKDKNKDKKKKYDRYSKDEWDFCDKSRYVCFELNHWYQIYMNDKGHNYGFALVNDGGPAVVLKGDANRSGGPTLYWRKYWANSYEETQSY